MSRSTFKRELYFMMEFEVSNKSAWEKLAALKCHDADEDDPIAQVLRSPWGRANLAVAARLTAAIEYADRVDTLRILLQSDLGRSDPERPCELALADSKISPTDAVKEDFDPRLMETEEAYW